MYARTGNTNADYYAKIFEYAGDAIFIGTVHGKFIDANPAACSLLGYTKEELLNISSARLFDKQEDEKIKEQIKSIDDNLFATFTTSIIRKDEVKIRVNVCIKPYRDKGKNQLIMIVRDVTEQTLAMMKLEKQNEYMRLLHEVSKSLLEKLDHSKILEAILIKAAEIFGSLDCFICCVEKETGILRFNYGLGKFKNYADTFKIGEGVVGRVAKTGKPLVIENYKYWAGRNQTSFYDNAQTCVGIPLKSGSTVTAVIGMDFFNDPRSFSEEEVQFFSRFADLASIAMVNAELHSSLAQSSEELRRKNGELINLNEELAASADEIRLQFDELAAGEEEIRRQNIVLSILNKTAVDLMQRCSIDRILADFVVRASGVLGTEETSIYMVNEDNMLELKYTKGGSAGMLGYSLSMGEGVAGKVAQTGEPLAIHDYYKWPGRSMASHWDNLQASVGVPINRGDKVIGVFCVNYYDAHVVDKHELDFLSHLAQIASLAIENADIYIQLENSNKELRKKNDELTALYEELTALYEELSASEEELRQQYQELVLRDDVLHRQNILLDALNNTAVSLVERVDSGQVFTDIIKSATMLVDTRHGYISFLTKDKSSFERKINLGYYENDRERYTLVTQGLDGLVYKSGKVMSIDDYAAWEDRLAGNFFDKLKSIASVPLKAGHEVIGIIGLGFIDNGRKFTAEELLLLERFGDLASVVLDNARLLESYKEEIAERKKAETALNASEAKYRTIFEWANEGIYIHDMDTGQVLEVNEKACDMCGYSRKELLNTDLALTGTGISPYSKEDAKQWLFLARMGQPQLFEWKHQHPDGHYVWVEVSLKMARIGEEDRIMALVRDISERKAQEERIRHLAYHDVLTDLPNRAYLGRLLEHELSRARQGKTVGAILFIDADDMKMINDNFGHSYGDKVIIEMGACISAAVDPASAVVGRIGGDEFIVLLRNCADAEKVSVLVSSLVERLSRQYEMLAFKVHMTVSVGVALYPAHGDTIDELYKNADLALYSAKESGKNTWRLYDDNLRIRSKEDLLLTQGLREVVDRHELFFHYQPIIETAGNRVLGFEALLRWRSPEYGLVPPGRFIPLAEKSEAINKIGKWVIAEACQFALRLREQGKSHFKVSVNISPKQLMADDFVATVRQCINDAGINPDQMMIEITENVLLNSIEDSVEKLKEIKAMGVGLAIDDFGTGYCSLNYMRRLPVGTLKIDKTFVDNITTDAEQFKFVKSMIDMAHVMGMSVIAEGVETDGQYDLLARSKCDYVQGYLFSRPVAEPDAVRLTVPGRVFPSSCS